MPVCRDRWPQRTPPTRVTKAASPTSAGNQLASAADLGAPAIATFGAYIRSSIPLASSKLTRSLGGRPGAFAAQHRLRYKNRKPAFQSERRPSPADAQPQVEARSFKKLESLNVCCSDRRIQTL